MLKGLRSYGGFKLRVSRVSPKISAPSSGETMRRTPKSFSAKRAQGPLSPCQLAGLRFHPPPRQPKRRAFVCWFVRLSVTLNVRVCAHDFAMKALEHRNNFDAVGYGNVFSCALVFNFPRLPPTPTVKTTKCRSNQNGKNLEFFAARR